jgi:hypothetical protein
MNRDICGNCGELSTGHTLFVDIVYRGNVIEYDLSVCSSCRDIFVVMLEACGSGKPRTRSSTAVTLPLKLLE